MSYPTVPAVSDDLRLVAPVSLYVYYQVNPAHSRAALAAITQIQTQLRDAFAGIQTCLMARCDAPPTPTDMLTWMETYTHPEGITGVMASRLAQLAQTLPEGLMGERHTERFAPVTPQPTEVHTCV